MSIREQCSRPRENTLHELSPLRARLCPMTSTHRNTQFSQTLLGDQICKTHLSVFLCIFPSLLFSKQRYHSSKNQTNDLLESRLFIYRMLPISHIFMPLRNLNLPHAVQGNVADFALYCFLHALVFKEDPSFEQQLTI